MNSNDLSLAAWKRVAKEIPPALIGYATEWVQSVEWMERQPGSERAGELEWSLWRSLCEALQECGAVTESDLKTSVGAKAETPGLRLLNALRAWGDARRAVVVAECEDEKEVAS